MSLVDALHDEAREWIVAGRYDLAAIVEESAARQAELIAKQLRLNARDFKAAHLADLLTQKAGASCTSH